MKKNNLIVLGIYDSILALVFIISGVLMIDSRFGEFINYPTEWLSKLPFTSWVLPGFIAIALFGIGNIIAAFFSFRKKGNSSWFVSALMGLILLISLVMQVIILEEYYLATLEFLILNILQLILSGYALIKR